jgi:hypothetical protein
MQISRDYVITPNVALFGCIPHEFLNRSDQELMLDCHVFLSRAAFHQAKLHVPMVFYSQILEAAFALYQQEVTDFESSLALANTILETTLEYHIPTAQDVLKMLSQQIGYAGQGDGEYLAIAAKIGCPIITTAKHLLETTAPVQILEVQNHPWASTGGLDDFPPIV